MFQNPTDQLIKSIHDLQKNKIDRIEFTEIVQNKANSTDL